MKEFGALRRNEGLGAFSGRKAITLQYLVNTEEHHANAFILSSKTHLLQVPPEEEAKGTHAAVCQRHSLILGTSLSKVCHYTALGSQAQAATKQIIKMCSETLLDVSRAQTPDQGKDK